MSVAGIGHQMKISRRAFLEDVLGGVSFIALGGACSGIVGPSSSASDAGSTDGRESPVDAAEPDGPVAYADIWDRDIRDELARNDDCPEPLQDGWWQRTLSQIDGLTFHHTLGHSPWDTAAGYVDKGGGRPSIPYTIWITAMGEILLCLDLTEGCWHDHTGHENTNLSVGLAGNLHIDRPPDAQLDAAARVAAWAISHPQMMIGMPDIKGHKDRAIEAGIATICPGWDYEASGYWKEDLLQRISDKVDNA